MASHGDYSTSLQEMQYTQIPQTLLISLILHVHIVLKRRRLPGWLLQQKAAVQREAHRASGMGRKDAKR